MAKTKLLLAFGAHGNLKSAGERGFFRDTIVPFLDEHVVREKKKAALIYETVLEIPMRYDTTQPEPFRTISALDTLKEKRESILKGLDTLLAHASGKIAALFSNSFDKGITPYAFATESWELAFLGSLELWGFAQDAIRLNGAMPDSIRFFLEPQNSEVVYLGENQKFLIRLLQQGKLRDLELMTEYMGLGIREMLLRDSGVVALADKLAAENPDGAIIIPRGVAHAPIEHFFDKDRYDVTTHVSGMGIVPFSSNALVKAYRGALDERELRLYAKLEMELLKYFESLGFDVVNGPDERMLKFIRQGESAVEAFSRITRDARAYVIMNNPETARELGIEK
jgi:hypothetical protein